MSVSRPGSLSGLRMPISASNSSGSMPGPIFTPMGLAMPRKYSTWAPPIARVRSPIQGKWVLRLYQLWPPRHVPGLRLLVGQVQPFVAGEELRPRSIRPAAARQRFP